MAEGAACVCRRGDPVWSPAKTNDIPPVTVGAPLAAPVRLQPTNDNAAVGATLCARPPEHDR